MSDAKDDPGTEPEERSNERLKLWLDLGKWVFGTLVLGIASVWINADLQYSKLELDRLRQDTETSLQVARQEHDIALAKLEQQRVFLESFVSHAMSRDILSRIRLAHYIKTTTTDPELEKVWTEFYEELLEECEETYAIAVRLNRFAEQHELEISPFCRVGGVDAIAPVAAAGEEQGGLGVLSEMIAEPQLRTFSDEVIARAARKIGVEVAAFRAVLAVEGGGQGFIEDGRPTIVNEPHIFFRELGEGPKRDQAVRDGLAYQRWGAKPYPRTVAARYAWLEKAMAIDRAAALRSVAWGISQIMGYHFERTGYPDINAFVAAQFTAEGQLDTLVRFLTAMKLDDELREKRWADFARGYIGPGYERSGVHTKLAEAYERFKDGDAAPAVETSP